jgi:hypothetical protein
MAIIFSSDYFKTGSLKDSISQSIKNILMTSPGEILGDPFFGCRLNEFLFELDYNLTDLIRDEIARAIIIYEPRVTIQDISFERKTLEPNKLFIVLKILINSTFEELSIQLPFDTQE